jgi:hypothetical protein
MTKQQQITRDTRIVRYHNRHAQRILTVEAKAPSAWACYLINGDSSGLDTDEIETIERWMSLYGYGACVGAEDYGFTAFHDARSFALPADCQVYTFLTP